MDRAYFNDSQAWPLEMRHGDDTDVLNHDRDSAIYSPMLRQGILSTGPLCRFLDESERLFFTPPEDRVDRPSPLSFSYWPASRLPGHVDLPLQTDRRHSSPASSALESSLTGSARSECRDSPWASPQLAVVSYPSLYGQDESIAFANGDYMSYEERGNWAIGDCVALHDVQRCADDQPYSPPFEDAHAPYTPYGTVAQEGYQPMSTTEDEASETSHSGPCSEYCPTEEPPQRSSQVPDFRRRRTHSARSIPSSTARVNERPQPNPRSYSYHHGTKRPTADDKHVTTAGNRAFPCLLAIYGCSSSFSSKNEWKRHINTQHMRLGFWRCDQCPSARDGKTNDFNRKDLFIQHVRRMHNGDTPGTSTGKKSEKSDKDSGDEQAMSETAKRCYYLLRVSPEHSSCLFCDQEFRGRGTWDERIEHIGRHMEALRKSNSPPTDPKDWQFDELVHQWLVDEQIITPRGAQWLIN